MKKIVLGLCIVAASGAGYWSMSGPSDLPDVPKKELTTEEKATQETEDERMCRLVPGMWETDREGRRVLTVKEDGSAIMDVTVEGMSAFLVGSKMKFNIKWKIVDGSLDFEMIDGEPQTSVDAVIKLYGKQRVQKILEFTEKKFVLKDNDGEEDHVWIRIDESESEGSSPADSEPAKAGA